MSHVQLGSYRKNKTSKNGMAVVPPVKGFSYNYNNALFSNINKYVPTKLYFVSVMYPMSIVSQYAYVVKNVSGNLKLYFINILVVVVYEY